MTNTYHDKEIQQALDIVKKHPGCKLSTIVNDLGCNYYRVSKMMRYLYDEGQVQKTGNTSTTRWYPKDYDRTQHNEYDNIPIVNKSANKKKEREIPKFDPSPLSLLGKEIAKEKEIPMDIYNVELGEDLTAKDKEKAEIPKVPKEESKAEIDIETVMQTIPVLQGIRTGTEADALIEQAIAILEGKLNDAVKPCPFCGAHSSLVRSSGGEYRIECTCGFRFANVNVMRSAVDTVNAYNKRVAV